MWPTGSPAPMAASGARRRELVFDAAALPRAAPAPGQSAEQLQQLEAGLRERDEKLTALLADRTALDEELVRLRAEVAAAKQAATAQPDTHDYSEAETRDYFIDLLLKEAGWPLDQDARPGVRGRRHAQQRGQGFVDYVLWGDDGKPLGTGRGQAHAPRRARGPAAGQALRRLPGTQFGQRPLIFYSNGYEHWLWDDTLLPAARGAGLLQEGRAGTADPAAQHAQAARGGDHEPARSSSASTSGAASGASPRASSATTSARRCW
jgi:type I restriction enzyme R subunit